MTPVLLTFKHDEDAEGWRSLCKGNAARGVLIRHAEVTGGVPQADPSFDDDDREKLKGRDFCYRIGTCCIGKMVNMLEKRSDS